MKKIMYILIIIVLFLLLGVLVLKQLNIIRFYNGRIVVRSPGFCSDVCSAKDFEPQDKYFAVWTKEKCEKINGQPVIDYAWGGGYIECAVK